MKSHFPLVMKSIAAGTALLTILLALLYYRFSCGWLLSAAITFGTICYHFAMRLAVGSLVPNRFHHSASWFQPRPWEHRLYQKLNVKAWKKHVPTYNPRLFSLEENTMEQIVSNMCQAEVVHEVIVLCSFVPLLFSLAFNDFFVFLITSILSAVLDLVFVCLQRYNRPRLVRILQKRSAVPSCLKN